MQGSNIYSDFSEDIAWIREAVGSDVASLPPRLRSLGRIYTGERLKILPTGPGFRITDPRMGRPVPYAAFWFAEALGLSRGKLRRLAGLSLVYASLATTLRDDVEDVASADDEGKAKLAEFWQRKYLKTLREIFPSRGSFDESTSRANAEWKRYLEWNSSPLGDSAVRPFSEGFLRESSRYFVAVVLPTLSAIAWVTGRESQVPRIERFLRSFSMGWRIFDDLMDWEKDLGSRELNRSSVLIYIRNRSPGGVLDKDAVLSWFVSRELISDAYGAMLGFLLRARRVAASFQGRYLDQFMAEQVEFHEAKSQALIRSADLALGAFRAGLSSVLPQLGRGRG